MSNTQGELKSFQ